MMSVGFLLSDPNDAVIWRGPKKNGEYLSHSHRHGVNFLEQMGCVCGQRVVNQSYCIRNSKGGGGKLNFIPPPPPPVTPWKKHLVRVLMISAVSSAVQLQYPHALPFTFSTIYYGFSLKSLTPHHSESILL